MKSERRRSNLNVKTFLHTPAIPDIPVCSVKTTFYSNGCEELERKPEIMKYSWSKTLKTSNCPSANVPWRQTHQLEIRTSSFARNTVGTPMGQKPSMAPRPQPVPWASSLLCDRVCMQKQRLWVHEVQCCLNAQDTKYDTDRRRWGGISPLKSTSTGPGGFTLLEHQEMASLVPTSNFSWGYL